jgi:hypothetical protein
MPWPKGVQKVAVSTVIRPVTQTAETEVNRASMNTSADWSVRAAGSISKAAPMRMTSRNAAGTALTGWVISLRTMLFFPGLPFLASASIF